MEAVSDREQTFGQREGLALAALVVVAIGLRLLHWHQTAAIFNDGPVFLDLARALSEGNLRGALAHPFHPLYPALIAAVEPVAGSFERAGVWVSAVSGAVAVAALFAFLRPAFGRWPAWLGAGFLAIHERSLEFTGDVQSEGLYLACFLGSVACLWRGLSRASLVGALAGGVLAGMAYLTRPEGLGLVLVAAGVAGVQVLGRSLPPRRALAVSTAAGLGAALLVAPYVLVLHHETGLWLLTQKKAVGLFEGVSPQSSALPQPSRLPVSLDYVGEPEARPPGPAPGASAAIAPKAEPAAARPAVDAPAPAGLAHGIGEVLEHSVSSLRWTAFYLVVGVFLCLGRPGLRGLYVLGIVGLYGLVLLTLEMNVGYLSRRHTFPPLTPTFGYAAIGLLGVADVVSRALQRVAVRVRPAAVSGVLLLGVAAFAGGKGLKPERTEARAEREAAEWLRTHTETPGLVAVRRRRVAYYAGGRYLSIPGEEAGRLAVLRSSGVRYLILDDAKVQLYPGLGASIPRELRPLHQAHAAGRSARVYELVPR
jgi:hypothetical protein